MRIRRIVTIGVLSACSLFTAGSAWYWAQVGADGDLGYAKARDAALTQGRQDIVRLNSVDSTRVDADLGQWLAATTGPLHEQLRRSGAADSATLRSAGTTTVGTVTDAAVTELDTRSGTARVIATVEIRLTGPGGTPTDNRKRFEASLSRTPDGWKITALTAVPVGAS